MQHSTHFQSDYNTHGRGNGQIHPILRTPTSLAETTPQREWPTQTTGPNIQLLPHHARMLKEAAISQAVIEKRGYRSMQSRSELRRLGFADSQLHVPTLLIPIWSVNGEIGLYHHRP